MAAEPEAVGGADHISLAMWAAIPGGAILGLALASWIVLLRRTRPA